MKKIIPYGDRILVKRKPIGEKLGSAGIILAADETKERPTDIAEVLYIPDHSFVDIALMEKMEDIAIALGDKATEGDSDALVALLRFNDYLKIKALKTGMLVMVGKYTGIDFHTSDSVEQLTMVRADDIIGVVDDE